MDGRALGRRLERTVWPVLRDAGFGTVTPRSAWRHGAGRTDLFQVLPLDPQLAGALGVAPPSFTVALGCTLECIPSWFRTDRVRRVDGFPRPADEDCHIRGRLERRPASAGGTRRDVWSIQADGRGVDQALEEMAALVTEAALPWYRQFEHTSAVLRILLEGEEVEGRLWGFGRRGSPVRHYLTGYVAREAGEWELARHHLAAALASGVFRDVEQRLRGDLERCGPVP